MRYLIVDGHSIIFAWPELRKLHDRRPVLARDALIKRLRDYQDWSGDAAVVVFDGQGTRASKTAYPNEVQIFYAPKGQSADAVIERLACKYGTRFAITVATADLLEMETVNACGAACISPEGLRQLLDEVRKAN